MVDNSYREPLPASFHVKVYHNDNLLKEMDTLVNNLRPGRTAFSLDEFGIPAINRSAGSQGDWTLVVYQNPMGPTYSKEAKFRVFSSLNLIND